MSSFSIVSAIIALSGIAFALYIHFTTKNKHNEAHHKE